MIVIKYPDAHNTLISFSEPDPIVVCCGLQSEFPDMVAWQSWDPNMGPADMDKWEQNNCNVVVGINFNEKCQGRFKL